MRNALGALTMALIANNSIAGAAVEPGVSHALAIQRAAVLCDGGRIEELEIVRLPVPGPSVDAIRLSTYGVIALVTGRGFHALLSLVPLAWGAALGAGVARTRSRQVPDRHWLRRLPGRVVAGVTAVGLVALTIGLAVPARTELLPGGAS